MPVETWKTKGDRGKRRSVNWGEREIDTTVKKKVGGNVVRRLPWYQPSKLRQKDFFYYVKP